MSDSLDIRDLLVAISRMAEGRRVRSDSTWYESQKEHWIGWLLDYQGGGAYSRKSRGCREARLVYNRLQSPDMVLYLAKESGVSPARIREATREALALGPNSSGALTCGAIRKILTWKLVFKALLESGHLPVRAVEAVARRPGSAR